MSDFYNRVSIGTFYFTDDGTSGGVPCRIEAPGLDALFDDVRGNTVLSADDTPYGFYNEPAPQGQVIPIRPVVIENLTVLQQLRTIIAASRLTDTPLPCVFEGDTGNYEIDMKPYFNAQAGTRPIMFTGQFVNGRIYGVTVNMITYQWTA